MKRENNNQGAESKEMVPRIGKVERGLDISHSEVRIFHALLHTTTNNILLVLGNSIDQIIVRYCF